MKCNTINKASACLKFQSDCNNTIIYNNSLNYTTTTTDPCLYGIWLDNSAILGDIGYKSGSTWAMSDDIWGDFSVADTYCSGNSNPNTSTAYKIYYDAVKTPTALYTPSLCINTFSAGSDNSQSFVQTNNSNTNTGGCGETSRLMNNTAGVGSGRTIEGSQKGAVGILNDFQTNDDEIVASPKKQIILNTNPTGSNNKLIKANESAFNLVDSLFESYKQSGNSGILTSAKNANTAINAVNNIEQNQKDFNTIYAIFIENDSLVSSNQLQSLINLAGLCPFTEGLAVYQARSVLRNYDDSTFYYNACENSEPELNLNASRLKSTSSEYSAAKNLQLYPNPSNGALMIEGSPKNGTFELYDLIGKKVFSTKLAENATQLDLSSFNNGTYLYKIVQDGITIKQDKLIISK